MWSKLRRFCRMSSRNSPAPTPGGESTSPTKHTTRVQRILLSLSTNIDYIPLEIQDKRIAEAILAISKFQDPHYHPKMCTTDIIELKLHKAAVERRRDEEIRLWKNSTDYVRIFMESSTL